MSDDWDWGAWCDSAEDSAVIVIGTEGSEEGAD